ncbi:MAG: hypothetical protein M3520_06010 [Actinomycetota bacterium]|nr:hypothetical protein [Actinomycetota bacterium]
MRPGASLTCSAKGCRLPASHGVVWNNPTVHRPERRKVWLACAEHRESLSGFVKLRGFLIEVVPVQDLGPEDG